MKLAEVDNMNVLYAENGIFLIMPSAEDYDPPTWHPTNCKYCGARLAAGQITCDYCQKDRPLKEDP